MTALIVPTDGDTLDPDWGRDVTNFINSYFNPPVIVKETTTNRNTTTTITDDPELILPIPSAGRWEVKAMIVHDSAANAAGDLQARFAFPTGWTVRNMVIGLTDALASGNTADANLHATNSDTSSPTTTRSLGLSTTQTASIWHLLIDADAAGDLTFAWAQLSSNANNSTIYLGSSMVARYAGSV